MAERRYKKTSEQELREKFATGLSVKEVARELDLSLFGLRQTVMLLGIPSFGGKLSARQKNEFAKLRRGET